MIFLISQFHEKGFRNFSKSGFDAKSFLSAVKANCLILSRLNRVDSMACFVLNH